MFSQDLSSSVKIFTQKFPSLMPKLTIARQTKNQSHRRIVIQRKSLWIRRLYIYIYNEGHTHAHTHIHTDTHRYIHPHTHTHTHIYIYIILHSSVCKSGFHAFCIRQTEWRFSTKRPINMLNYLFEKMGVVCTCA